MYNVCVVCTRDAYVRGVFSCEATSNMCNENAAKGFFLFIVVSYFVLCLNSLLQAIYGYGSGFEEETNAFKDNTHTKKHKAQSKWLQIRNATFYYPKKGDSFYNVKFLSSLVSLNSN